MDSPDVVLHELSRSLTPLSADSNDEVNSLSTAPVTSKLSLANRYADEGSDLSPLTSSDEEEEETPHPISSGRTLRPRVPQFSTLTVERSTSSPETMSLPSMPPPVDRPSRASRKRKRSESPTAKATFVAQEQRHGPGPYVSEDRCHQCRNRPRYAFMRCTPYNESGRACRKLFCVSCCIKRYPDDIDFNPRLKMWECPFCAGTCNCTKCCAKRNENYTSTSGVKIDHDTLLHYAALMPGNSNPRKPPPPPPPNIKNSKLANKPKLRPSRNLAKTKPGSGPQDKVKNEGLKPGNARDVGFIISGLADTAAMFEKFGCVSGEYWGVVFSNVDGGRIGVAYVGDRLPDIFIFKDEEDGGSASTPPSPPAKRLRASSRISA